MNQAPTLVRVFAYLSLLTVGGGMAAFPEMKVLTVDVRKWLTFPRLIHIYSVGQMAPGPNMMMIVVIGQWAGGFFGALVTVVAFFGPTALLAFAIAKGWRKLEKWPWRQSIQQGLAPVSIGLLLAGCFTMAKGANHRVRDRSPRSRHSADPASVQNQSGIAGCGWSHHRNIVLHAEIALRRLCRICYDFLQVIA